MFLAVSEKDPVAIVFGALLWLVQAGENQGSWTIIQKPRFQNQRQDAITFVTN